MGLKYPKENRAFSLLELIIAVAILSIGITAVIQALAFSARVAGLSCDITEAVILSRDKIQELEFRSRNPLAGSVLMQADGAKEKFSWHYALIQEPDLNLNRLNFTVNWQRMGREEKLSLDTYLKQ